jgi:hypothetical protein
MMPNLVQCVEIDKKGSLVYFGGFSVLLVREKNHHLGGILAQME